MLIRLASPSYLPFACMPARARHITNAELLALIRVVAAHASPNAPTTVSQRRFDAAREPSGRSECPRATNLTRRFGQPWSAVLELAHREMHGFHTDAMRSRAQGAPSEETAVAALASIARRLGMATLRPHEYEHARHELLEGSRGQRRQALRHRFPTAGQFVPLGDWDELLVKAGLERRPPARAAQSSLADVVERFLTDMGYWPSHHRLVRFGNERRISVPHTSAAELDGVFEVLRIRRANEGLWAPPVPPPSWAAMPWYSPGPLLADEPLGPVAPKQRLRSWTLESVQAGLRIAVESLGPGERLNQPTLRRLAKTDDRIPAPSVVGRKAKAHGTTFSALRAAAVSARAAGSD